MTNRPEPTGTEATPPNATRPEPTEENDDVSTKRDQPNPEREPDHSPASPAAGAGGPHDLDVLATSPFDDDLERELAAGPRRSRPPMLTLGLAGAVVAVVGFVAGIQANRMWGHDDSASPAGGAIAGARGQAGGQGGQARPGGQARQGGQGRQGWQGGQAGGGFGGQGGAGGFGARQGGQGGRGLTAGTVEKVSGGTIYLRTADGKEVKITTSGSTKVRVTKDGSLQDLKSGAAIVVQGTPGQDGAVAATNIAEGGALGGGFRQRMGGGGTP